MLKMRFSSIFSSKNPPFSDHSEMRGTNDATTSSTILTHFRTRTDDDEWNQSGGGDMLTDESRLHDYFEIAGRGGRRRNATTL